MIMMNTLRCIKFHSFFYEAPLISAIEKNNFYIVQYLLSREEMDINQKYIYEKNEIYFLFFNEQI